MERQSVASSLIRSVGYDPAENVLEVELIDPRRVYTFHRVPAALHAELMLAPSKGLYFNEYIRSRFPHQVSFDPPVPAGVVGEARRPQALGRGERNGSSGRPVPGPAPNRSEAVMIEWSKVFTEAMPYPAFLDGYATPSQRTRWDAMHGRFHLTAEQTTLLGGFTRRMQVLCLAGAWCGDCINQCPVFDHFAQASPAIDLRFLDRDVRPDIREELSINGGHRVPVLVFLSEDGYEVSRYGERTLSTYRRMAAEYLGPSCPTGFVPPADEALAAMTADWLGEFERAQLILRLSPRLRALHGD